MWLGFDAEWYSPQKAAENAGANDSNPRQRARPVLAGAIQREYRRMIVKRVLKWLAIGVLGAALTAPAAARQPNIVFILADDLGYGDIGPFGQTTIRTPALDRMAREGMRFTRHYAGSPVCAPSRCVLMTGRHPGHAFIRDNREVGWLAR